MRGREAEAIACIRGWWQHLRAESDHAVFANSASSNQAEIRGRAEEASDAIRGQEAKAHVDIDQARLAMSA